MGTTILFLLALTRVTAMVMTAPILGSRAVPLKLRMLVSGVLTITTFTLIESHVSMPQNPLELTHAIFNELTLGLLLGLGVMIVFAAAQMAGTVIGQIAGIQAASLLDVQGQGSSPVSQLFGMLSFAAFAIVGGPELIVSATLDSFVALPVGTALDQASIEELVPTLLQQSFILTLRGVAPAVAALLLSTIAIGWVSRSYPQMNLLQMGLSSNLLLMFLAISLTLGGCVWLFVDDLNEFVNLIGRSVTSEAMAGGLNE